MATPTNPNTKPVSDFESPASTETAVPDPFNTKPNADPFAAFDSASEIPDIDPFDPAKLRLTQDFIETAGVKKLLSSVPVRKPHRHDFFRVRPEPEYRDVFGLIQVGADKDFYLVQPTLAGELPGELNPCVVYTVINRQATLFLWPVRLAGTDGRLLEWWETAHQAANFATKEWIRIAPNKDLGAYEIMVAQGKLPEPDWPDYTFRDLLRTAFQKRLIDRPDHEVIRQLRGLV